MGAFVGKSDAGAAEVHKQKANRHAGTNRRVTSYPHTTKLGDEIGKNPNTMRPHVVKTSFARCCTTLC